MRSIEHVLALWKIGVLSSDAVVAWADDQILSSSNPRYELLELSLAGPAACLKRPIEEFSVRPLPLSFAQEFCTLALTVDLASDKDALWFARWAAQNALTEDLDEPLVMFSYRLDHLLDDCNDPGAAVRLLRDELPPMIPRCESVVVPLFGQVPNNSFKPKPLRGSA